MWLLEISIFYRNILFYQTIYIKKKFTTRAILDTTNVGLGS